MNTAPTKPVEITAMQRTSSGPGNLKLALRRNRSILVGCCALGALMLAGALMVDSFLSSANLKSMLLLAAFLALASLGQTLCALLGALDLSIPFMIGAANIGLASLISHGVPTEVAIIVVLIAAAIVGLLNGMASFRIQGQALIVTLGMGFAVVGGVQILVSIGSEFGGNVVAQIPTWLSSLASMNGSTFGIPVPPVVVICAVVGAIVLYLARTNRHGRAFYAIGGNRTSAKRLSISEWRFWLFAYMVSAVMAAVTGMVLLGFSGGGYVGVGDPYLFTTVAAVVIGGTSLLGGHGGYGLTILGALVLTVLTSLLVGLGLSYAAQQSILGLLIVPMVALYARTPHLRMQI